MKKFLALTLTALLLAVVMSVSLFAFNTTAATENVNPKNVIFISDDYSMGDGSGKDAENPLRPVAVDDFFVNETIVYNENNEETNRYGKYYLRTALYQAAEKLVDTGGTIVICGPVSLNASNSHGSSANYKDFTLPTSECELTITSKYNNVDYAKTNGAKLEISAPSYLLMGSPSTFENITIHTTDKDRAICACGNKIVMGDGINSTVPATADGTYYISIAGGKRYGDYTADSHITIKSGTYYMISGSTWGVNRTETAVDAEGNPIQKKDSDGNLMWEQVTVDGVKQDKLDESGNKIPVYQTRTAVDVQTGDVTINLLGGIYRGKVCGTSTFATGVALDGDIYINISGNASLRSWVYLTTKAKFASPGCKGYIKISGGSHGEIAVYGTKDDNAGSLGSFNDPQYNAAESILDVADDANIKNRNNASDNTALLAKLISVWNGTKILYPSSWIIKDTIKCSTSTAGTVVPTTPDTFINGVTKPVGAIFKASFLNKSTQATIADQYIEYDERNTAFKMTFNDAKTTVWYRYGKEAFQSAVLKNYIEAPTLELLGARLKTKGDKQALRFVAEYTLPENATINEAGILALKSYMIKDDAKLTLDGAFGNIKYVANIGDMYTYDGNARFECMVSDINQREFIMDYTAKAYIKYTVDGVEYVAYSDAIVRNPYEMARVAVGAETVEDEATVTHLNDKLIYVSNNFDVKNQYVSDEELAALRKSVVDYMELQANIEWSPKETFAMYNNTGDRTNAEIEAIRGTYGENLAVGVGMAGIFEKGKTYYGMPYTSSSKNWMQTSNFESFNRLMELTYEMEEFTPYDGPQVPQTLAKWNSAEHNSNMLSWMYYNLREEEGYFGGLIGGQDERRVDAYMNYTIIPGSHCSKAVFSAWNVVLNNSTSTSRLTATYRVVPGSNSNVFAVGDYNYKGIATQNNTREVIESNGIVFNVDENDKIQSINYEASKAGLEVMYNAYKSVKPGDGLIHYTDSGHTRMVVDVTYNAENPGASIVKTIECANWSVPFVNTSNGTSAVAGATEGWKQNNSCWMVREYSFDNLLITTYIPSRITELSTGLVDKLSVVMTDTDIANGELNGTIKSNMQIVSVDVTVTGNGINKNETIYLTSNAMHLASYDITKLDLTKRFGLTEGETYSISLKVGTPGYISGYTDATKYPNDVDYDDHIATSYTPTFTTIWNNMAFVAPAALAE